MMQIKVKKDDLPKAKRPRAASVQNCEIAPARLYTPAEVCLILGWSYMHLHRLLHSKKPPFPFYRIGAHSIRIKGEWLAAYLETCIAGNIG